MERDVRALPRQAAARAGAVRGAPAPGPGAFRAAAARHRDPGACARGAHEATRLLLLLTDRTSAEGGAAAAPRLPARTARRSDAGRAAVAGFHGPGPRSGVRSALSGRPARLRPALLLRSRGAAVACPRQRRPRPSDRGPGV